MGPPEDPGDVNCHGRDGRAPPLHPAKCCANTLSEATDVPDS
jgi:hypothetical protein